MASVSLSNLTKTFPGGVCAVDDVSLDIADGELLVLLGPSGCGKTTLLRMIAGLETPTSGAIRIGEKDVAGVPPRYRDIAMVFQDDALYPHMTARQNLAFALKMRKTPKQQRDQRIEKAAKMLGIKSLLHRRPEQLSGGQRQRVAIGRAVVREPRVFLFDEPLSHLDTALREQLRGKIAELHERLNASMVVVTHDQAEAIALADRIVQMENGRFRSVGRTSSPALRGNPG